MQPIFSFLLNYIFAGKPTPTVNNPWIRGTTTAEPPTGWILAGFLLLLLIVMLYQQFKSFVKRVFRKKQAK
jgi:hypothetical protein